MTPVDRAAQPRRERRRARRRRQAGVLALALAIIGICVGVSLSVTGTSNAPPTTVAFTHASWVSWLRTLEPTLATFDHHYDATAQDLSDNTTSAAHADLVELALDAHRLRDLATSPDAGVNRDLVALSTSIKDISTVGLEHWPMVNTTALTAATHSYLAASKTLTAAVLAANSRP